MKKITALAAKALCYALFGIGAAAGIVWVCLTIGFEETAPSAVEALDRWDR